MLGLAKIRLAEDFSFEGLWEWGLKLKNYMKFAQFVSNLQIWWLSGQINDCLENFVGNGHN